MTVFIPLKASTQRPHSPSYLVSPPCRDTEVSKVIRAIMKAKRMVVVCGAGISVSAGIPDFRSSEGLFQTLKRDNPRELLCSGKDLFDASVFNSENSTSMFCQMIARLSELSAAAEPTPFHQVLRSLDDRGRLLRVYTQNIDAIESKSGMLLGVPVTKPRVKVKESRTPGGSLPDPDCSPSNSPPPNYETPRCIPLHGTLENMHCQICTFSFPLKDHLASLTSGTPPDCPECVSMNDTRSLVGKRSLSVGKLRPSVVLYNELHKDGEAVGEQVRKDLMGKSKGKGRAGADLLLVVGTSLRVPGTKRIVREFAKAVRSRSSTKDSTLGSSPSSRRTPTGDDGPPMKSIYLNLDFPVPTREWDGVFDAWLQGDAQIFAGMLQDAIDGELAAKELVEEKKRKREEEAAMAARQVNGSAKAKKKTPAIPENSRSPKRRKVAVSMASPVVKTQQTKKLPVSMSKLKLSSELPEIQPKVFLRIPPIASNRRLVPEVYITTPPSVARRVALFTPPTSVQTSYPGGKGVGLFDNPRTNVTSTLPILSSYRKSIDESEDEYSDLSDVSDELPTVCMRSGLGQYSIAGC